MISVERHGSGPEVLLVHGGASPSTTWRGLEPLRERWQLVSAYRRGYPPSAPFLAGHMDFEVDADDLLQLLDAQPHVVAHSYGALGALLAVARRPVSTRSLTLIEPALYLPAGDPEVARLERMGNAVLRDGPDSDPATLMEFLQIAGAPVDEDLPLSDPVVHGIERAHGGRSPSEARPDFDAIRRARVPCLVASGEHTVGIERMCDAVAAELGARRIRAPGAGHFVPAAPGFVDSLHEFLVSAA